MKTNIINLTTVLMLGGLGSMYASNHAAAADIVGQRGQMPMATGMSPGQKPAIPGPRRGRVASDSALGNSDTPTPPTDRAAGIPSPSLELAGSPNTPPTSEKVYTVEQYANGIRIVQDRENQLIIALKKAEKQVKTLTKQVSQLQAQAEENALLLADAVKKKDYYRSLWVSEVDVVKSYMAGRPTP
jgi:hypothetical protein